MSICEYYCVTQYIRQICVMYRQLYLREDTRSTTNMHHIVHEYCQ